MTGAGRGGSAIGPASRLAAAALLIAALGVAAGAAAGRSSGGADLPDVGFGIPRSVFLAIAAATLAVLVVLAVTVLSFLRPDDMPDGAPVHRGRHPLLVVLSAVVPALLIVAVLVLFRGMAGGGFSPPQPPAGPAGAPVREPGSVSADDVVLPIVAFGGALVASAFVVRRVLWGTPRASLPLVATPAPQPVSDVADALDDGLDALLAEQDPRRAVVRAYSRMELAMSRRGWARRPSEGPTEYVARVLSVVPEDAGEVAGLTELYVFARFSPREITPGMREEAIALVRRLRSRIEEVGHAV